MSKGVKKVVLAYSGGLDTSIILRWLQDEYQCEVVTFTADLGQLVVREVNGVARRFQVDGSGRLESDDSEHCSHEKAKLHYVDFFLEELDQIKL